MRGRLGEAWACLGRLWGGLRGPGGRLLQDMTRQMSVTCETTLQALGSSEWWVLSWTCSPPPCLQTAHPVHPLPSSPGCLLGMPGACHSCKGMSPCPVLMRTCARDCTECRIPHVASRGARISSLHALSSSLWPPWPCPWPVSIWQPLDPLPHQPWTSPGPDTSPGPPPPALDHRHQPWTTPVPAVVLTP